MSTTPARMSPQYQVYSLPGTSAADRSSPSRTASSRRRSRRCRATTQNFNLTAWMVGHSDPAHYGQLTLYEVPQGTLGPANADAEISANQRRVLGHHAAGPARVAGAAGRDADGPDRQLDGVPAAALRGSVDQPAAPAGVRDRRARQERGFREDALGACPTSSMRRSTVPTRRRHRRRARCRPRSSSILQQAQTDYTTAQTALPRRGPRAVPAGHRGHGTGDRSRLADRSGRRRRARRRRPPPRRRAEGEGQIQGETGRWLRVGTTHDIVVVLARRRARRRARSRAGAGRPPPRRPCAPPRPASPGGVGPLAPRPPMGLPAGPPGQCAVAVDGPVVA